MEFSHVIQLENPTGGQTSTEAKLLLQTGVQTDKSRGKLIERVKVFWCTKENASTKYLK